MVVRSTHIRARALSTRLASSLAVGAGVGSLEWLCSAPWSAGVETALRGWLALASVWALVGGTYGLAESVLLRASLGVWGNDQVGGRWSAALREQWRMRHDGSQPQRVGRLLGRVVGALLWTAGSAAWVAYLVQYRHGAWLIALAALVGQGVWALACAVAARIVGRALVALLTRASLSFVHVPAVAMLMGLCTAAGVVFVVVRFWDLWILIDAPALGWPLLLIAGQWLAIHAWKPARAHWHRVAWAVWGLCWLLLPLALGAGSVRAYALREAHTSKYLIKGLMNASDVDGDGAASYPFAADCAPWDGARHPMAVEQPGNGVDENCDGTDELTLFRASPHDDFKLPPGPRPNLVLITMDATRADHLGFMGYGRDTTPHLDALAARSVVFTRAFSQDSGTAPSFWSMHTGKTPFQVKLRDAAHFPPRLDASEVTLAQLLRDAGYHTEGVMCGEVFDSPRLDVRRGFTRFRNVCGRQREGLAQRTTDAALQTLDKLRKPFFLWVHYYDPHGPYEHVKAFDFGRGDIDRYDSEIRYADEHIARLTAALDKPDVQPTFVAFTADHGENFGEHGRDPHARNLYRVVTHVPLLVHGPGLSPRRIEAPVASNDLFPTLLQLARQPQSDRTTMTSQVPVLFGLSPDPGRIVFQENSYSRPRRDTKGAVRGDYHFILDLTTGVEELYDYVRDPSEQTNLVGAGLAEEAALRSALLQFTSTTHVPKNLSK